MSKYLKYIITLRYVKLWSYFSAKYLQQVRQENHKHRYTYYYGFQVIYGTINGFLLLILLGLLFNILPQLLIVTLSFIILRVFAGGLHFDSYTKCAYFSLLTFLIIGLLAKYIYMPITITIVIFLIIFVLFLLYAPVENKNRPLKGSDKIKFKLISILLLAILFFIHLFINNIVISNSIVYGVLLSGIITLPIINKLK